MTHKKEGGLGQNDQKDAIIKLIEGREKERVKGEYE